MATIKSYTDLEQSKRLVEILPIESADICYVCGNTILVSPTKYGDTSIEELYKKHIIPAWSLAALRNLLPVGIKINENTYLFESHNTFDKSWVYRYYNEDDTSYLYCKNTNEIDVCYETVLKLHDLKIL